MTTEKQIKAAEAIKGLRTSTKNEKSGKHLSHVQLSKELQEKEDLKISPDSLMMYEVTNTEHSKFGAIDGMSAKTICALADYYGVNTDYILGRTDIKTADANLRAVCEYTGLAQEAIETIIKVNTAPGNEDLGEIQNIFLGVFQYVSILKNIRDYMTALTAEEIYWKLWFSFFSESLEDKPDFDWDKNKKKFDNALLSIINGSECSNHIKMNLRTLNILGSQEDRLDGLLGSFLLDNRVLSSTSIYRANEDFASLLSLLKTVAKEVELKDYIDLDGDSNAKT